jgi:uncharacterized protein YkwD
MNMLFCNKRLLLLLLVILGGVTNSFVLAQSSTSSQSALAQSESLIALKFHEIINEYRETNLMLPYTLNDTLCIAAKNHNKWMVFNDDLDHVEKKKGRYFTGREVNTRINYASNMKGDLFCGENILHFTFALVIDDSTAIVVAHEAFEMWRNSPGHNANMLRRFKLHGIAFDYADGLVWGTNVFCGEDSSHYYFSFKRKVQMKRKRYSDWRKEKDYRHHGSRSL